MAEPITVGYGQNKWVKDSNTKSISLTGTSNSTSYSSLSHDGSTYQVPVGKKFTVLHMTITIGRNGSAYGALNAFYNVHHATTSTGAGNKIIAANYVFGAGTSAPTTIVNEHELYIEVPAGEYITMRSGNTSTYLWVTLFGVEDDA